MKRRIILLSIASLTFIVASIVMLGVTYGWFTAITTIPDNYISVGDLRYTPTGSLITSGGLYLPGEEIVDTAFTIDNSSPIESQLRIKIEYTRITYDTLNEVFVIVTTAYTGIATDHLVVSMDGNLVNVGDYYYYGGASNVLVADSGVMNLVSSIYYDGTVTTFDYAGQAITVTLTVEVKQADNVTWAELIGYDFSTGYLE